MCYHVFVTFHLWYLIKSLDYRLPSPCFIYGALPALRQAIYLHILQLLTHPLLGCQYDNLTNMVENAIWSLPSTARRVLPFGLLYPQKCLLSLCHHSIMLGAGYQPGSPTPSTQARPEASSWPASRCLPAPQLTLLTSFWIHCFLAPGLDSAASCHHDCLPLPTCLQFKHIYLGDWPQNFTAHSLMPMPYNLTI